MADHTAESMAEQAGKCLQDDPNKTEETDVEEYVLADGTRVIKTTITTRIKPTGPDATLNLDTASDFERAFLEQHNQYRAMHGVHPLQLSRDLCAFAQEWAEVIALEKKMRTRPHKPYGESVFSKRSTSMKITGQEAVKNWYEGGVKHYKWYGAEPPGGSHPKSGNFTQMVWRSTERVGVGLAVNGNAFYVVANYDPPGNCITRYKYNVMPPKK